MLPRIRLALGASLAALIISAGLASGATAATPAATEFSAGITADSKPTGIAAGPDGNLWFTEPNADRIGRITPAGAVTEFSANIPPNAVPADITAGPDGNLWFTEFAGGVGRITPAGAVTQFSANITAGSGPDGIAAGPDGNLWFTEINGNRIGRITPAGVVTEFSAGITADSFPLGITAGPDGNLWFTEFGGSRVGRITPAGVVKEFSTGIAANSDPAGITVGPDGNLWFTESNVDRIGRITPSGTVTEFSTGITLGSSPEDITAGPDGNLWFTERTGDRVGRITPAGVVTEFITGITPDSSPQNITAGPDGNLWFTEQAGRIGRINTALDSPAFANLSAIAVPATGTSGSAAPYPSEIAVSGLRGTVTDVRVRLSGLAHSHPDDLEFLLQAPDGATALLDADSGGLLDLQAATLTFDDASPFALPDAGPIVSGIFHPSSFDSTSLPAPAPAAPYGATLASFDGINPNGAWKLFVNDDGTGDVGVLRGGWGLDVGTTGPPPDSLALRLKAKSTQKAAKLKVRATCSTACDLVASVKGMADGKKFKSKKINDEGGDGSATKLKIPLAKPVLRKVEGEKGKATIRVTATASDGETTSDSANVKLK